MFPTTPRLKVYRSTLPLGVVVAVLLLLTNVSVRSAQNSSPPKNAEVMSPTAAVSDQAALTAPQQNGERKQSKIEKTKTDAAELSALADKLRDELNHMNVNVFALDVIQKTEAVEKLAKKIKGEAYEH